MPDAVQDSEILKSISKAKDVSSVVDLMHASCLEIGGDKLSYHPEIMFEGMASAQSEVFAVGFPEEWVKIYTTGGGKIIDPVPDIVMRKGRVMTWSESLSQLKLTNPELELLKQARSHGLLSGLGFPLWGPKGQNAFVAIGFPGADLDLPSDVIQAEHMLLLAGHRKIVELLSAAAVEPSLSGRECEVLTWIGKGKSNTDIAAILAISPETVATYKRRIYIKLNCHDRIGAVVKALRLGLIRI